MADVLFVDATNFADYPPGGLLAFTRQMMKAFGNRLALVGVRTDPGPVGEWMQRSFDGLSYECFYYARWRPTGAKPFLPRRMSTFFGLRRHRKRILSSGIRSILVQTPEALLALGPLGPRRLCYIFHGTANPLDSPRYRWARVFARPFENRLFSALSNAEAILACADRRSIQALGDRAGGRFPAQRLVQFPTRVDTDLFKPIDRDHARQALSIPEDRSPLFVCCGRLNRVKGWDLVLDAFSFAAETQPRAHLYFVGDGEDRASLEKRIDTLGLRPRVTITGFQPPERVARHLAACDAFLVGSRGEGWSVAMLEALACGCRIVSTDVSGADDMILNGVNGEIVADRDPRRFAEAMERVLTLRAGACESLARAKRYTIETLARDLGSLWEPLG